MKKYSFKYSFLLPLAALAFIFSCQKEFPKNVESNDEVVLHSIKIVNAGAGGNGVVEGTVDEDRKTVSFPRLDTLTDFSHLRFDAVVSGGASLDKDDYQVEFAEGEAAKTIVIKVVNNKRYREYLVNLRLMIPVYGADFDKPAIHDNTNNELGNPVYPAFVSLLTRGSGFDGEHVLVVTRAAGGPHLLKVSDLRTGAINPITLNLTGVAGGTFAYNQGAMAYGHTYVANLSTGISQPLRIYHWTDPSAAPDVIGDIDISALPGAGARHGDNMSANIDENGNGYIFFGDNSVSKMLRVKVTNFTTISDPTVLPNAPLSTFAMTMTRVGSTDDYIYTGYEAPIRVANESAVISYSLPANTVPTRGCDARVVYFNGERYLMMTTAARGGSDAVVLYVYDITKGENITEALQLLADKGSPAPIFQYSMLGPVNIAPITQTGYSVKKDAEGKDDMLTLYAASADAGFVVIDFPKKTLDD